jgi:tripartite-type tricarboxylate transporter receptor subunit TctC
MPAYLLRWLGLAIVACLLCAALTARAQDFPVKPIRILSPFTPGSLSDVRLRKIADLLSPRLKQPVVIENRTGGGGALAALVAAHAAPDGYTLLFVNDGIYAIGPHVQPISGLDPLRQFAPVIHMVNTPFLVVVPAALPVRSLQELIGLTRQRPGSLNYGTSGVGTVQHLGMEQFARMAGMQLTHIPYKGETDSVTALLGGQIDVCLCTLFGVAPHLKSGKLRALAVTAARRLAVLPEVPTIAESGFPGYSFLATGGIVTQTGTPGAIVSLLNREIAAALATSDLKAWVESVGGEVVGGTPEQFGAYMRREYERYGRLIKQLGLNKPQ